MLEIIIAFYAGICWLLIKKFKLIPWNFKSQVVVFSLPIFGTAALILSLNYYCPISHDVRVFNRSVDVTCQVMGRVKKVYVKTNQEVKKGDTLFVIDKEPYLQEIKSLEAKLSNVEATVSSYDNDIAYARKNIASMQAQLTLANKRVQQFQGLVNAGAANKFDLEQAVTDAQELQLRISAAQSQMQSLITKSTASFGGENSSVSETRARLDQARWNLSQTAILAPTDGTIPNMQLNEGAIIAPFKSAFVLIQKQQSVVAFFAQNEVEAITRNNEVELALKTEPGKVIKARLKYVIDATSQGLMNNASGMLGAQAGLPDTAGHYPEPDGKLIATFVIDPEHGVLTTGARGSAVIYSDHVKALHMVRKVMIRVNSKLNYIIPKLH
ncbi:HlyD family secretion protein [Chryseobacterium sp. NFX27]|uniref:HlyD family secretion protein n=1 Tax=Chryseobacterium sp. NFX27 TaxID=2819618 RepID=UPI003CF5EF6D